MDYDAVFEAYYALYRGEEDTPSSTDAEYSIGLRLANEAVNRWANYDNTFWRELFTTAVVSEEGGTIVTGTVQYDTPANFKEAGGSVRILSSTGTTVQTYPILSPEDPQFKSDLSTYATFTGSPVDGYVLNLNPSPPSSLNGLRIQYDFYKKPTLFVTGTDITEMSDPYFIVHRMLANRFRVSRNPYYTDALRDAENALGVMKMTNDSGSWGNPWKIVDRSGSQWGR